MSNFNVNASEQSGSPWEKISQVIFFLFLFIGLACELYGLLSWVCATHVIPMDTHASSCHAMSATNVTQDSSPRTEILIANPIVDKDSLPLPGPHD